VSVSVDWKARAEREAAAILANTGYVYGLTGATRDSLTALLACAWLQGFNLGSHETIAMAEDGFARLRAEL
jgi:hypothetical protein